MRNYFKNHVHNEVEVYKSVLERETQLQKKQRQILRLTKLYVVEEDPIVTYT